MSKRIGILGGLGPMASAEFLKTIYEVAGEKYQEQDMPAILMLSDPKIPDRTQAIVSGNDEVLLKSMLEKLIFFENTQVDLIVICCVVMHYFIPKLPEKFQRKVVSILENILNYLKKNSAVILCASASRRTKLFENHVIWPEIESNVTFLDEESQDQLDQVIRSSKRNGITLENVNILSKIINHSDQEKFVISCSEIHMLAKALPSTLKEKIYDPFLEISKQLI